MASNLSTDPVQTADSIGQNNDSSALEISEYSVPSWFVSDNVKTAAQLSAIEPKLVFSELASNKNCSGRQDGAFTVCRQTFLSVRDTLASCLVRDADGEFSTHSIGAILSYSKDQRDRIFAEYLDALAKELGAALVTLTLHDFQALAAAFEDETPAETRRALMKAEEHETRNAPSNETHPAHRLVLRYFAKSGKATADAGERWKHAFAAVLNAQDGCTNGGKLDKSHETATSTTSINQPLIVHIAESHEIAIKMEEGGRIFARLKESVIKAREAGKPVILVISGLADHYELRKSGVVSSAAFTIRYVGVPVTPEPAQKPEAINSTDFVNKLKFLLRWGSRHFFDSETLLPRTKWIFDHAITSSNVRLDDKLLDSIAVQVMGRALGGRKLTFEDIERVVSQVLISTKTEREGIKAGEQESDTDSASDVSDDDDVREPSRQVKADKYESHLLSSVIKAEELQDTKYEDVILNGDIKEMMRQLVQLSKMKIKAKSTHLLSCVQISGALLYGPPGTGKTHLSRAIANSMGSNMLALDSAVLQCKYVGETEKYIKAAFSLARKLEPCIIFLDEVDALFYRRASDDRSWQRSALTQFLQEMDGLGAGQPGAPFVLVATNRPGDLDTAFLRRLPQKIYFELPDTAARAQILRILLNEEDLSPDVDIDELAALTDGYSGSDLKSVCAEAALLWVLKMSQKDAKEAAQRAKAEAEGLKLTRAESSAKRGSSAAEMENGTARDASNLDSGKAIAGSEVTNEAPAESEAGGEGHEAGRDETGDAPTNETAAEKSKRLAKELRKEERIKEREERKMEREIKRQKREAQEEMEALYMERLSKVCLTKALFEKALQRMRPTVSKESIRDMERFAQRFSNK
ncbi:ATPase family AAA domain-containing protein 1-A [Beauveria brongniartii RCEF 3172]|uniref:ATPase family AAA domain-containing protein 1-A n=1 Tax=Beauveria brongniartii RCEF 3172 TaxID=1081107 RepID=A0A162JU40_9HYPO|nr:ATPase family AAA domain-containing protein 1-A [Beauveria brongniartii RCEF 3172]